MDERYHKFRGTKKTIERLKIKYLKDGYRVFSEPYDRDIYCLVATKNGLTIWGGMMGEVTSDDLWRWQDTITEIAYETNSIKRKDKAVELLRELREAREYLEVV